MNIARFAVKHNPTQRWVKLTKYGTEIDLVDNICDATLSPIGPYLRESIKNCSYDGNPDYVNDNYLEFALKTINIQYTVLNEDS